MGRGSSKLRLKRADRQQRHSIKQPPVTSESGSNTSSTSLTRQGPSPVKRQTLTGVGLILDQSAEWSPSDQPSDGRCDMTNWADLN